MIGNINQEQRIDFSGYMYTVGFLSIKGETCTGIIGYIKLYEMIHMITHVQNTKQSGRAVKTKPWTYVVCVK